MTDASTRRAMADLMATMYPAEQLRRQAAVAEAIDPAGRITPRAAAPLRRPQDLQWGSGDTRSKRVAAPGTATLIAARCDTAPSSGACVVAVSWESETTGLTALGECRIPPGGRFGEATIPAEVATLPAGAWVRAQVTAANGATGVDISLMITS